LIWDKVCDKLDDNMKTVNGINQAVLKMPYGRFHVILRLESAGHLPFYKGSMLRGAFGHAFKKAACVSPQHSCDRCAVAGTCSYRYVFETPVPENSERMKKYPNAPHPFIIRPVDKGKTDFEKDNRIAFEHTLFGEKTISALPYMLRAFELAGENGLGKESISAKVETVYQIINDGNITLYKEDQGMTGSPKPCYWEKNGDR
jgi:hypothetical protein